MNNKDLNHQINKIYVCYVKKKNAKILNDAYYKKNKNKVFELNLEDLHISSAIKNYRLGKFENAFEDFARLLEILRTISPVSQSYPLFLRGIFYRDLNKYSDSLKDFNKSIEIDRNQKNLLYRAIVKSELGDIKGAIYELNWLLSEYYYDTDHAYFIRACLKSQYGDKIGAILDLNKIICQNSENIDAYFLRSKIFRNIGKIQSAESDERKVFELQIYEKCLIF